MAFFELGHPATGYWKWLFGLVVAIFFMMLALLILCAAKMLGTKSGFAPIRSDTLGGMYTSGANLRFGSAPSSGFPGGVVSYQSFVNPEPPVFYDIGDVASTRAYQTSNVGTAEGLAPTIGLKKGFDPNPNRWRAGFTDQQLLATSRGA